MSAEQEDAPNGPGHPSPDTAAGALLVQWHPIAPDGSGGCIIVEENS